MPNVNVSFAKIVASPTSSSWSQAYNAGNLFIVLSLEKKDDAGEQLNSLGKSFFNDLEAEFFTLEEKTLNTISHVLEESVGKIPSNVGVSLTVAFIKQNTLYIYLIGAGKIMLKRKERFGALLKQSEPAEPTRSLESASGIMENEDILILETEQFSSLISPKELLAAFELSLPSDIAESLSPTIHKADNGAASAIILRYHGLTSSPFEENEDDILPPSHSQHITQNEKQEEPDEAPAHSSQLPLLSRLKQKILHIPIFGLPKRKLYLVFALIVIGGILIVSVIMTITKQQETKNKALLHEIIATATKSIDEGKELEGLNKNVARDDFLKAKKTLEEGKEKFPPDSEEEKEIVSLLTTVNDYLKGPSAESLTLKEGAENMLLEKQKSKDVLFASEDESYVYILKKNIILRIDKNSKKEEEIVKNDDFWTDLGGFDSYNGNLYVLDRKKGVLKFTDTADGYTQSDYFKDKSPDLALAMDMSIDSSVFILKSDGKILKFTKGAQDAFAISSLIQPFKSPTRIFTNADTASLYILDAGNNRLVRLAKNGTFEKDFASTAFGSTKDIVVSEKDKKGLVLANDKIYEFPL